MEEMNAHCELHVGFIKHWFNGDDDVDDLVWILYIHRKHLVVGLNCTLWGRERMVWKSKKYFRTIQLDKLLSLTIWISKTEINYSLVVFFLFVKRKYFACKLQRKILYFLM